MHAWQQRLVAIAGVVVAASACRRTPSLEEPFVDRSDGALPTLKVPKARATSVTIDGRLDEAAWLRAASTGPFVHPSSGRPEPRSKVNAIAKLVWNDEHLYVGAVVHDAQPTTPFGRDQQDPHIWAQASGIELMIQPGDHSDNRDYFEVQVDVGGAVWDTHFDDYNSPVTPGRDDATRRFGHQEWQSGVERATVIDAASGKYTIELALPWSALKTPRAAVPPKPGAVWRMNFYSFRDGQRDSLSWSPLLGKGNFHRSARFGRVELSP